MGEAERGVEVAFMKPDLTVEACYRSYRKIDPSEAEEAVAARLDVDADNVRVVDIHSEISVIKDGLGRIKHFQHIYEFVIEIVV